MKKIIAVILFMGCLFAGAQDPINPKPGDKFIYNVDAGGQQYDFIFTIKSLSPNIVFEWNMTNEGKSHGKLTIPAAALVNSNKMYNYFSNGNVTLKNQTSVFLSKGIFKTLTTKKTVDLYDGDKKLNFTNNGKDGFGYKVGGDDKYLNAIYMSTDDNNRMTVTDNPKFPIILSMDLGWSIRLAEYVPVKK